MPLARGRGLWTLATIQLAPALLTLTFSVPSALANDLPLARVYHLVADICINEMLANKDATANLIRAGSSLVVYCGCVSLATMGHFTKDESSLVARGVIPESARPMWIHWHQICIDAGH